MAKNVLETRKRVAHYKNGDNFFDGNKCLVSTIIQEMDSKFSLLTPKVNTEESCDKKSTLLPQEDFRPNVNRAKKFSSTKKFPLMEKTQKTLKQLRHNRKMPKPRAHLTVIAETPLRSSKSICSVNIPNEETKKPKLNITNSKQKFNITNSKQNNTDFKKRTLESNDKKISVSKKIKSDTVEIPKPPAESLKNNLVSSDDDDSDYEKFLQQNKTKKCKTTKLNKNKKSQLSSSSKLKSSKKANVTLNSFENKKCKNANKSKKLPTRKSTIKCKEKSNRGTSQIVPESKAVKSASKSLPAESDSELSESESGLSYCKNTTKRIATKKALSNLPSENDSNFSDSSLTGLGCRRSKRTKKKIATTKKSKQLEDDSAFYESPSTSSHSCRRSKRVKTSSRITEKPISPVSFNSESELDFDNDVYTRDSSDSDVPANEIFTNRNTDTPPFDEAFDKRNDETPLSEQNYTTANVQAVTDINNCSRGTGAVTPVADYETSASKTVYFQSSRQDTCNILNLPTGSISTENVTGTSSSNFNQRNLPDVKHSFNNSSVSTSNVGEGILIDLCDSDSERGDTVPCISLQMEKSNFAAENIKIETSDEPEIELLDVIILEKNQNNSCTSESTTNCKINIKTEKDIPQTTLNSDVKPNVNLNIDKNSNRDKIEAAYTTDICRDHTKVNEIDNLVPNSNDAQVTVKKEKEEEDDDIMIIDSSNTCSSSNLSHNTKNVKCSEIFSLKEAIGMSHVISAAIGKTNTFTDKELKLYEVACNNLKPKFSTFSENANNLLTASSHQGIGIGKDHKTILQELKNEYATYLEIIRTEASIGATFKSLEQNQAKKLLHLKSLLASHLKSNDAESPQIKEIKMLMSSPELNSSGLISKQKESSGLPYEGPTKEAKGSEHVYSLAHSSTHIQDLETATPTVVERDVKPDVTKLQIPKSPAANDMSFGEKCIICGKDAVFACLKCAKVFFCSDECGRTYWEAGHAKECCR